MTTEDYQKNLAECYLDNEQRIILESNANTIIKAGPGSGKTRVLTLKAAKLLLENIKMPRGLACITYTNKATQELKNRLNIYGIGYRKNLFIDTIHKFCMNNILYPFASIYNKEQLLTYKIITTKSKTIMDKFYDDNSIPKNNRSSWNIFFKEYRYTNYKKQQEAENWYNKYANTFYDKNCINFDLVMDECYELLQNNYICKCIESKYPYILIDEYQDSSLAMHSLFKILMEKTNIVFYIVGDPNQSIYSFTASSPKYYNELYKTGNFNKIELKKNYRTHNNIFSIVKNFLLKNDTIPAINTNTNCYFKKCSNLNSQIEYIASNILPKLISKGILPKDICILYRDYHTENVIIDVLTKNNISFTNNNKIYVSKDYNDSELVIFIEDLILWLLNKNKNDKDLTYKGLFSDYLKILYKNKILSNETKKELKVNLYKKLIIYQNSHETLLKDFINYLNDNINLKNLIELNNKDELDAYKSIYEKIQDYTLEQFADVIESENAIRILSAHSSKGLEYKAVIIPDLEDGRYPTWSAESEEALNEEKRLLFVATTRAKEYLFILASGFYTSYGKQFNKGISRFFNDIKSMFLDCDNFD